MDATTQVLPPIVQIADFLCDPVEPAHFPAHILRWRNDRAAATIGLETLDNPCWVKHFGRFAPLPANLPHPLALRYHGHQFGHYNPDLGDGRGFLFAQLRCDDGRWLDLGTKGSGQTPYSRSGDGRLTLKGAVRELLATEMLEALGVPTSRTFSIIETGETLHRGDEPSPARGAVLVRLNHGHIRIGSFQRLAALGQASEMERLLRYCLSTLFEVPNVDMLPAADAAAMLVRITATKCAETVAAQMVAGFVHGVLNSDNINITGESFDYGPWRFTPTWDPAFTAAYFDHQSLYAFGRQAQIVYWNVGQLAISLRSIAPTEPLTEALETFAPAYEKAIAAQFCWRLGVSPSEPERDRALVTAAERFLQSSAMPIDRYFQGGARDDPAFAEAMAGRTSSHDHWWHHVEPQSMQIDEVETLWDAIASRDDWQPLMAKVCAVREMGSAMAASHSIPPIAIAGHRVNRAFDER
ncbi:MAG: protein adenylyltransferase SelO family protein [Sphingopyxis sp.]